MKIFPESNYSIELNIDSKLAVSKLENQTLSKEQFVTNWNNQSFIGIIKENEFEIKLSKQISGEFCILNGKLENKKEKIEIRTGKIFKIIFLLIISFTLSAIILAIIQNKLELIFYYLLTILIIRFVFLELGFKIVSKITVNKLTEIIEIKQINKTL
ncbi:hypothetical protein GON26_02230 [Flavobacterium sp. GA093]|uniref:Uncharacterized protein n=1 Tax=Flavobacterium hydrocarbonoxydans TaxID=2683249 RepID=A0A6I4NPM8_9FLAO|nr:hypothetical protein [Flavobacterium hydrocarbonoxydans]MWB93164.1 hypothetical protein [Flavobacterium hydrocarbonoxydans]